MEQRITEYSDKIVIFRSNVCTQFKLHMLQLTDLCGIENIFIELKFHQICAKLSKFHWICVHIIIFSYVNCLQASSLCPFPLFIDIVNLPCKKQPILHFYQLIGVFPLHEGLGLNSEYRIGEFWLKIGLLLYQTIDYENYFEMLN